MYINKTCGCVLTESGDIKATAQIKGLLDVYTPETSKSAFWKYWKCFICCHGDFNVQIRFADEPFGTAGELVQKMLQLFDQLHFKLGDRHFDYTLLGREQVTIDFSKYKYISELFKEMRTKMEWDSWYGQNLDALWDILRGMPYKGDDFTIIRPRYFTGIPHGENAAFTDHVDKICSIFQKAQEQSILTVQFKYTDNEIENISDYMA